MFRDPVGDTGGGDRARFGASKKEVAKNKKASCFTLASRSRGDRRDREP